MKIKTFYHQIEPGHNAKVTISDIIKNGKIFYYASVIDTDFPFYKGLSDIEQKAYPGANITNGEGKTIYYSNPDRLEYDIRTLYGKKWLETEI